MEDKAAALAEEKRQAMLKAFGAGAGTGKPQGRKPEGVTEHDQDALQGIWGDYADYMGHQRDKGWKT